MMKMKKLSAAILAVVMLVSMLSCMVLGATAAGELGGPIAITKVTAPAGGVQVSGVALSNGILVVNSDWAAKMDGDKVNIKLGNIVYSGIIGTNAFGELGKAANAAKAGNTIYVAPGVYSGSVALVGASNLKIYGPQAAVNPNNASDIALPNASRPAANIVDFEKVAANPDLYNEAVILSTIDLNSVQYHTTDFLQVQGLYFADSAYFNLAKGSAYSIAPQLRNNIFSVSCSYILGLERGHNPGILFEDNRVLQGKSIVAIGGMMDCTVRNNYLNLSPLIRKDTGMTENMSAGAVYISSVSSASSGSYVKVEDNYFENCSGIVRHNRGTKGYNTVNYSLQVKNNRIARVEPGQYLIQNMFYAMNSSPGINVQFTGNEVYGVSAGTVLFGLPYLASEFNLSRYRYMININNNTFDIPVGTTFVNSEMAGTVNVSNNTFINGISMDQITHADDCDVILYPYYTAGGDAIGAAKVTGVQSVNLGGQICSGTVNEEEKLITYDLMGTGLDKVDLTSLLEIGAGCTFKVYKEATLATKVNTDSVYLDGHETTRYIVVSAPDGASTVYRMIITGDYGSKSELLEVVANSSDALVKVTHPQTTKFVIDHLSADLAYLNFELNVSAGATYTLYDDYLNNKLMEDLGGYIPYGGYTIDVLVTSEDKSSEQLYTLEFNRARSDFYDPSVIEIVSPEGQWGIRPLDEMWMYYICEGLRKEMTFELKTTPGATYAIYTDEACTKKVSASDDVKALKLTAGINTFYVKVTDKKGSNIVYFEVINDTLSSDATITGILGNQPRLVNNVITLAIGGNSSSLTFVTNDPYAVCEVYADAAGKLKIEGTSVETPDLHSDRVAVTRTFPLETVHATSKYFVKCIAEDGVTSEMYTLYLTKITNKVEYLDVASDKWYAPYVEAATAAGLIVGETTEAGTNYRPEDKTTREEIAVIMARLTGINGTAYANVALGFKDEASISEWALNYVKVCKHNGLMNGSNEGNGIYFLPSKNTTREEVMVIFARMFNLTGSYDLSEFADSAKVSGWAKASVEAVVKSGLVEGADGYLNPGQPITRAELATLATRAMDFSK